MPVTTITFPSVEDRREIYVTPKTSVPLDQERPFEFDELFFSRTDERGVIQAGNSVFQSISAYSWDEILRAPHRLIRHPDMPRGVFWLMWDTIQKGNPIGAYVKNLAKDGRYYWVFAVVTPIEGGFLSVRLKPSSTVFEAVKKQYAALRDAEVTQNVSPKESAARLTDNLAALGYDSYSAFMAQALSLEISARNEHLGRTKDASQTCFERLAKSAEDLLYCTSNIADVFSKNKHIPLNLKIHAAQLGDIGTPIGTISDNYTMISNEIQQQMSEFVRYCRNVSQAVGEGWFLTSTAMVQRQVIDFFQYEETCAAVNQDVEMQHLRTQQQNYSEQALKGLRAISSQIELFSQSCAEMRRLSTSLKVIRVIGKIESASIDNSLNNLDHLIDDLGQFQSVLGEGLDAVDVANKHMRSDVDILIGRRAAA